MDFLRYFNLNFWNDEEKPPDRHKRHYSFRHKWAMLILTMTLITFIPLAITTYLFYQTSKKRAISELKQETRILTRDTALGLGAFFDQYRKALALIFLEHDESQLRNQKALDKILRNLNILYPGFTDLDIIDANGKLLSFTCRWGRCHIPHTDAQDQWLRDVKEHNFFIKPIFAGAKNRPIFFIGIKNIYRGTSSLILRASLKVILTQQLVRQLASKDVDDIFLITETGKLLTPSKYFGSPGDRMDIPSLGSTVDVFPIARQGQDGEKRLLYVGIAPVTDSSMYLGMIISESNLEKFMRYTRNLIVEFATPAGFFILFTIVVLVTILISRLYEEDKIKKQYLEEAEQSNKLASLGRLATGVAHEINNPLAIINEKAGFLKDLFTFTEQYSEDPRIIKQVNAIEDAVHRAGTITHRLLGFARHMDVTIEELDIRKVIDEVLVFVKKEANYKGIDIHIEVAPDVPPLVTDHGKLQQILLNLITNAFAALGEGGRLDIIVNKVQGAEKVSITVRDTGCGIPEENIKLIFEPFFSTSSDKGNTGLGLAIIYGLIQELGGQIELQSKVGEGSSFIVTLPVRISTDRVKR